MRIGAQPGSGGRISAGEISIRSIRHLTPRDNIILKGIRHPIAFRIGRSMPAPLRLSTQGHALLMKLGKCLQARDVGGENEPAVAHAQRSQRVGLVQRDIMPADQGMAVDLTVRCPSLSNFWPCQFGY